MDKDSGTIRKKSVGCSGKTCRNSRERGNNFRPEDVDRPLIDQIRDHDDQAAFEELMIKYRDKVWRLARGITRSDEDAEDVMQEVFMIVYQKLDKFEGRASFSSWLYRIAANASYMKLRARKNVCTFDPEELDFISSGTDFVYVSNRHLNPEAIAGSEKALSVIKNAIEKLPAMYRTVLVLIDIEEFSAAEVSDMLGLTISTVKSRLHRSRIHLRKRLGRFYETEIKGVEKQVPYVSMNIQSSLAM